MTWLPWKSWQVRQLVQSLRAIKSVWEVSRSGSFLNFGVAMAGFAKGRRFHGDPSSPVFAMAGDAAMRTESGTGLGETRFEEAEHRVAVVGAVVAVEADFVGDGLEAEIRRRVPPMQPVAGLGLQLLAGRSWRRLVAACATQGLMPGVRGARHEPARLFRLHHDGECHGSGQQPEPNAQLPASARRVFRISHAPSLARRRLSRSNVELPGGIAFFMACGNSLVLGEGESQKQLQNLGMVLVVASLFHRT
jgi:hypothetical protein